MMQVIHLVKKRRSRRINPEAPLLHLARSARPAHPLAHVVKLTGIKTPTADPEAADQVEQFIRIGRQRLGRGGSLLRHGRIVLCRRIELVQRRRNRAKRRILLGRRMRDLSDDVAGGTHLAGNPLQRFAGLADEANAVTMPLPSASARKKRFDCRASYCCLEVLPPPLSAADALEMANIPKQVTATVRRISDPQLSFLLPIINSLA
jgi:hypothetical protein